MTTTQIAVSARRADAAVLRRIWRLHFWVGVFAAPALVVLAFSGLVILYSEPIEAALNRSLLLVSEGPGAIPLDDQVATARQHVGPGFALDGVAPPAGPGRSTRVDFLAPDAPEYPAAESELTQVFVDPYTGAYLGQRESLSGLVGFANQVHRMFGNDGPQVPLPSFGHLINPEAYPDATIGVGVANLWLELTAMWILVLLCTGVYLWWPRAIESVKPLLRVRWGRGGRIRWRDLHASLGIVLSVMLICQILSGLTWTRYWGENWRAFSSTVAPSLSVDAPSTPATMGDYDRLGRRIAWAATDDPVYASAPAGPVAAKLSLADIDRIAKGENMVPGYLIIPPADSTVDGDTVYGSYAVVNPWPQRLSEQRTLFLDQFSGKTIANATAAQDGALARLTSFGIDMHMGYQLGVLTRITATLAALGVLAMVATGFLMWWKRRPSGSAGLPGPLNPKIRAATPKRVVIGVGAAAVVLGVLFPAFGASVLLVFAVDRLVDRQRRKPLGDQTAGGIGEHLADADADADADAAPMTAKR
ncbi:PepSY-associated TM helix domain-containing protein [Mycolicibacterium brumae]|uniref:PepSY domain-containing protein n=1 Tax=Mycolicibacterium brumae TaxID=85968 RepID=A0A2G5PGP8_9MYCO|nr:PepSY domain-containing protein [Mycolicibacterium brumae]MCV7192247.1 PepSY domain-containing protein [Mycolicibacterium brumae]PIB77124.1 PepSY domain-containing protein [Mycolicibacterium brumae]RWA21658.1 hypothetical protein MBRU_14375 [Mycolicibacterium brumae DSM 44177]UWW10462.1 PepSY domain-containing protein [Mycolicibacterium brumae]